MQSDAFRCSLMRLGAVGCVGCSPGRLEAVEGTWRHERARKQAHAPPPSDDYNHGDPPHPFAGCSAQDLYSHALDLRCLLVRTGGRPLDHDIRPNVQFIEHWASDGRVNALLEDLAMEGPLRCWTQVSPSVHPCSQSHKC